MELARANFKMPRIVAGALNKKQNSGDDNHSSIKNNKHLLNPWGAPANVKLPHRCTHPSTECVTLCPRPPSASQKETPVFGVVSVICRLAVGLLLIIQQIKPLSNYIGRESHQV